MKINDKALQITITIIIIALFVYSLYIQLKPVIAMKKALKKALNYYPLEIVQNCERIYRKETAHFTSGQFRMTFSPGMERFSNSYPFGWTSLKPFWDDKPEYKPVGFSGHTENKTGITKYFIIFKTVEAGVFTLCEFLEMHNNNGGRWYALDTSLQQKYNSELVKINPSFTNANI
jgi:hypothetical protein